MNGSFIKPLKNFPCNQIFIDIEPESTQIARADFLNWHPPEISGKVHVIGNPPFGKQSSLCLKFINHASTFAETFGFILPATFLRPTKKNKIPLNFKLVLEKKLPDHSFGDTNANCVFQVWRKSTKTRAPERLVRKHPDFEFLRVGDESACFCMRNAGSISSLGKIYSTAIANRAPKSFH